MLIITATDTGTNGPIYFPATCILAYWPNKDDPTKTTIRHQFTGSAAYQSVYDGTVDDLTALLTS